jgi:DNA-binding PadR family transcriptional regulator
MRGEHRHGMRDEGWGPPRPGGPEWGPRPGRGGGRSGGERGDFERGDFERGEFRGRGPGGPGRHGGPGGRRWAMGMPDFGPGGPGFGFGPGGPMGPEGPVDPKVLFSRRGYGRGGRGSRVRKGDVRAAILDLLAEGGQWNGYQLIQEIAGRTSGVWRPSAGSVYPALQQLEDEGLIAPEGEGRRRMYSLTDAGRTYAQEHADELSASWDAAAGMTDEGAIEFHDLIRQVMMAVMEVRRAGSADQLAQARAVLAQARRSLYLILAEDGAGAGSAGAAADYATADDAPQDDAPEDTESSGA